MFLSTLAFSATHHALLTESYSTRTPVLAISGNAITALNGRLRSLDLVLSNETIGVRNTYVGPLKQTDADTGQAVAMLAATESIKGNIEELHIHMIALTKMVGLRGVRLVEACCSLTKVLHS